MKTAKLFIILMLLGFSSESFASIYLVPKVGAVVPTDGSDTSYSIGAGLGYEWLSFFSTEFSYSRLLGTGNAGDGDILNAEGIFHMPLAIISPYASGGVGLLHSSSSGDWDSMLLFGVGIDFTALPLINLGFGVTYAVVNNKPDFIQPVISVGLNF